MQANKSSQAALPEESELTAQKPELMSRGATAKIPPISKKDQPKFLTQARKQELAAAFLKLGASYDRLRPDYPAATIKQLIQASDLLSSDFVTDLGAGTGKLSLALAEYGFRVKAVDPSEKMLAQISHPLVQPIVARAEETSIASQSQKLVVAAQAWHWFDVAEAGLEVQRILKPGGYLALIWNNLDVSKPFVHRYSRIAHSADVLKADHNPLIPKAFELVSKHIHHWEDIRAVEDFIYLALTRSYGATAKAEEQERIINNLKWYFYEHLGYREHSELAMPYRTDLYLYQLKSSKSA